MSSESERDVTGTGRDASDGVAPDASGYERTWVQRTEAQKKAVRKLRKEMRGQAYHGRRARFVPGKGGK